MEKMEVQNRFLGVYNKQYFEVHRKQCSSKLKKMFYIIKEDVDNNNNEKK